MTEAIVKPTERFVLRPFDPAYAEVIAGWVQSEQELLWLAPSTAGPLTADKISAWQRPSGDAFVYAEENHAPPVAYGELNPMRREPDHLWVGHVIVSPAHRGQGIGQAFVRAMLDYAFETVCANRVSLIVFPGNLAALRCYRRVGFEVVGHEHHRFGRNNTEHRFLRLEALPPRV